MPAPNILIVDDDPATVKILYQAVDGIGRAHAAMSGAQALSVLAERPIDLVLLDIIMPEMDGYQTCRTLLKEHPDVTVLFVTVANDSASELRAFEAGAHDFIAKPINPAVVRARVSLHLSLRAELAARQRMEKALLESNELLSLFIQHSPIHAYIKEVAPDDSRVLIASENFSDMIGIPGSQMAGKTMRELFPEEFAKKIAADDWTVVSGGCALTVDEELNGRQYTTLKYPIIQGERTLLAGYTIDTTERKRYERDLERVRDHLAAANAELNQLATTDLLTGISNRRHFQQVTAIEMARARRYGAPLSLLMFDIDHFKSVNDRFGHQAGDRVLIELTEVVQSHLRETDLLARWGGEEFVAMLPHCGEEEGLKLAEKLRALIASRRFSHIEILTASFGIAEFKPRETLDDWIKRADDAMYCAKAEGRNTVRMAH